MPSHKESPRRGTNATRAKVNGQADHHEDTSPVRCDPQRDTVYLAEQAVAELLAAELDGLDQLQVADLVPFAQNVMQRAGWSGDAPPTFVLDVADDDDVAAWHEGLTGDIHLHPKLLDRWTVLHEVAHWLRPRDGHGPQFCGVLVDLIDAGIGAEAGVELLAAFADLGVDVDTSWCDVLAGQVVA